MPTDYRSLGVRRSRTALWAFILGTVVVILELAANYDALSRNLYGNGAWKGLLTLAIAVWIVLIRIMDIQRRE